MKWNARKSGMKTVIIYVSIVNHNDNVNGDHDYKGE